MNEVGVGAENESIESKELSSQEIIRNLMVGVAPEREAEINELWAKYNPEVIVIKNRLGITLDATKDRIRFDSKTMGLFWLIGFSGWRAIECYSPHVIVSATCGISAQTLLDQDADLADIERTYKERLAAARGLNAQRDIEVEKWPPDIPQPSADRSICPDQQYQAAFDLSLIAVAYTFLHEFRHVMLDFDGHRPSDRKEEELQADVWARDFITAKLDAYATANGHDYHDVLRKRSMGLAIAALILHEITPQYGGNCDYFSIKTRLGTLLNETPLPENDHFWVFAAALLLGICRQQHIVLPTQPMAARVLANSLLDLLPD